MSAEKKVSDELRNAFVDAQLDAPEWARVAAEIERDPVLREDVCQARRVKDLVRHAYAEPPLRRARADSRQRLRWPWLAAASILFALSGWFAHAWWSDDSLFDPVSAYALRGDRASVYALRGDWHKLRSDWRNLDSSRVLIHVSSGSESLATALEEIEDLLRSARAEGRTMQIEIVANNSGLDLLKANASPIALRLAALRKEFPNLGLVACGQTIARRKARGEEIDLVPGTAIAPSALEQVIERLRSGWIYVRA